jgi:hypothetical protein
MPPTGEQQRQPKTKPEKVLPPIESLQKIAENPGEKQREVANRIAEQMGLFKESAEQDIDRLTGHDHTKQTQEKRKRAGSESSDTVLTEAMANVRVLNKLVESLTTSFVIEIRPNQNLPKLQSQIEAIKVLRKAIQEAIDGYNYRFRHELPSGKTQVENLIAQVSNGEMPSDAQDAQLRSQPDIADMYSAVMVGVQICERFFKEMNITKSEDEEGHVEYPTVAEFLNFTTELSQKADASVWTEEDCERVSRIIQMLKEMSDLAVFDNQSTPQLEALSERINDSVDEMTGLELMPQMYEQFAGFASNLDDKDREGLIINDPDVSEAMRALDAIYFTDKTEENNCWVTLEGDSAQNLLALARRNKERFAKKRAVDLLLNRLKTPKIKQERAELDKKAALFATLETMVTKTIASQEQFARLQPIVTELQLYPKYIRLAWEAQNQQQDESEDKLEKAS